MMTPNEYQKQSFNTALPQCKTLVYMALGLSNEAGEVAGKVKKVLRGDAHLTQKVSDAIADELGDTLWYLAGAAQMLGTDLESIMRRNIDKIAQRKTKGTLQGNGDKR
jgi:NTP pyrophosphatase (non-canonical NTP hydrolase)